MAKQQIKLFSKAELKVLVYKKMQEGKSYNKAVEEVKESVVCSIKNHKKSKTKEKKADIEDINKTFKEDFAKMVEEDG